MLKNEIRYLANKCIKEFGLEPVKVVISRKKPRNTLANICLCVGKKKAYFITIFRPELNDVEIVSSIAHEITHYYLTVNYEDMNEEHNAHFWRVYKSIFRRCRRIYMDSFWKNAETIK